jgi:hypothetical protein
LKHKSQNGTLTLLLNPLSPYKTKNVDLGLNVLLDVEDISRQTDWPLRHTGKVMNLTRTDHPQTSRKPLLALCLAACLSAPGWGQKYTPVDLTQASLEELANLQVTSVSKKEQ